MHKTVCQSYFIDMYHTNESSIYRIIRFAAYEATIMKTIPTKCWRNGLPPISINIIISIFRWTILPIDSSTKWALHRGQNLVSKRSSNLEKTPYNTHDSRGPIMFGYSPTVVFFSFYFISIVFDQMITTPSYVVFQFLDCDLFFVNSEILRKLIEKDETVVAPLLISNSMYSNFWGGMSSTYYYARTEEYLQILNREKTGCFVVPMVHSATLIDLNVVASDLLTFDPSKIADYDGPTDDVIAFAVAANTSSKYLFF